MRLLGYNVPSRTFCLGEGLLVVGDNGAGPTGVFNAKKEYLGSLSGFTSSLESCAIGKGLIVTAFENGVARVYEAATRKFLGELPSGTRSIKQCAIGNGVIVIRSVLPSPDEMFGTDVLQVYEANSRKFIAQLQKIRVFAMGENVFFIRDEKGEILLYRDLTKRAFGVLKTKGVYCCWVDSMAFDKGHLVLGYDNKAAKVLHFLAGDKKYWKNLAAGLLQISRESAGFSEFLKMFHRMPLNQRNKVFEKLFSMVKKENLAPEEFFKGLKAGEDAFYGKGVFKAPPVLIARAILAFLNQDNESLFKDYVFEKGVASIISDYLGYGNHKSDVIDLRVERWPKLRDCFHPNPVLSKSNHDRFFGSLYRNVLGNLPGFTEHTDAQDAFFCIGGLSISDEHISKALDEVEPEDIPLD